MSIKDLCLKTGNVPHEVPYGVVAILFLQSLNWKRSSERLVRLTLHHEPGRIQIF